MTLFSSGKVREDLCHSFSSGTISFTSKQMKLLPLGICSLWNYIVTKIKIVCNYFRNWTGASDGFENKRHRPNPKRRRTPTDIRKIEYVSNRFEENQCRTHESPY